MTSPVQMFFSQPRGNNHPIEIWRICVVAGRYLLGSTHSEVEDIYSRRQSTTSAVEFLADPPGMSVAPEVAYPDSPGRYVS